MDETFKELKKIDRQGSLVGCSIYNDKHIYVTDYETACVYLMDNELNILKTFGSKGSGMDQFNCPCTIFCQNEYLFVSDHVNKRIQILTLDLKYFDTIQLNFGPRSIAVSSTTIGISETDKIFFYDIKTKNLKKEHPNIFGRINLIESYFYVVSLKPSNKLFIFDQEGELINETSIESISEHIKHPYGWDGFMLLTKDYLIFLSYTEGKVLRFKL